MSSLPDPKLDYSKNPVSASIPPADTLRALYSPLNTLVQAHFREYGHDAIDTLLALFAVWSAVHSKTRQQRVMAVVASIFTSFSWFIYARYTVQAFGVYNTGAPNPFCTSMWNSFPGTALNIQVPFDSSYCTIMRGTAVCSILLLLGRILLAMYSIGQFYETKGQEPYNKLDQEEIQQNNHTHSEHQQLLQQQHIPSSQTDIVIESQPKDRSGISSPSECSLTPAGHAVMFFIWLTLAGFIITMLSFIELIRLDHQQAGILFHALGNRLFDTVMVYPMLQLFFSISFGAFAAYDRLRDHMYNPLLLNFLGTISLWGIFIYSARRLTLTNCPTLANGENCMEYPASQRAMTAGWGIMSCSELLRMGAMIWKIIETPKTPITSQTQVAAAAKITAPTFRMGKLCYTFCNSLYLLIIFAYFLVILAEQSMTGLFQVQSTAPGSPKVGFLSPFGQSSVEDILEYPYHNFAISILSMSWMVGANHYVDLGGTRSSTLSVFVTQIIHCGAWLAICFPPAYAMFTTDGYFHDVWCVDTFTSIYGNDPCNYITASGRLGILFFSVMVINTCFNGIRLLSIDILRLLSYIGTRRQATRDRQSASASSSSVHVGACDAWWLGECSLWLTICGWLIYSLAAAVEGQKSYFVGHQIDGTFGFNIFQYISVHYFAVAILLGPGITTTHLLTNKDYRQHSYGWRLGMIVTFIMHVSFLIVMIVLMSRYVYHLDLNTTQLAMFSGLVIILAGDVFSFVAFRTYFLFRPVVRLVPAAAADSPIVTKSDDIILNKDIEIAMVPVPATARVNTSTGPEREREQESNSAHDSDPHQGEMEFEPKPTAVDHQNNDTNTHWHMDADHE